MKYGICHLAVVPLRAEASDTAEIVTQLVFGDYVEVLTDGKPWIQIKNNADGYIGWMDKKQLVSIDENEYYSGINAKHFTVANKAIDLMGPNGQLTIFLGSSLPFLSENRCRIGDFKYEVLTELDFKPKDIVALGQYYLNAPYLWGGKSMFGIDCSGLTQNLFKVFGVYLSRNASQQVLEGKNIDWEFRQVGDAVFFTTSSEKITHVGLLISKDELIHAHGHVRIDHIDQKGIYNDELDAYTHKYYGVRRYLIM